VITYPLAYYPSPPYIMNMDREIGMTKHEILTVTEEGFFARLKGFTSDANPYKEGTHLASLWADGWDDADYKVTQDEE